MSSDERSMHSVSGFKFRRAAVAVSFSLLKNRSLEALLAGMAR